MNPSDKLTIGLDFLKSKFFGLHKPLMVSWETTFKCNSKCKYCDFGRINKKDAIGTKMAINLIKEMGYLGTKILSFTGGEPLLRKDIELLVGEAKKQSIYTNISTNGSLLPKKIHKIRDIDMISVSIDGPKKIHDFLRGGGSYENVLKGLRVAKEYGVKTMISTTLCKQNISHVDFILNKAKELNVGIIFQPVERWPKSSENVEKFQSTKSKYVQVIEKLISVKKKDKKLIINSISGLVHLKNWPDKITMNCPAGKLICRIGADGKIYPCSRYRCKGVSLKSGLKKAFKMLSVSGCEGCFCSNLVEISKTYSFDLLALLETLRH